MTTDNFKNMPKKYQWVLLLFAIMLFLPFFQSYSQQRNPGVFTLTQCVEMALKHNPQILASGLTVAESQARIDEVQAGFYPTLSLNATRSQSNWENSPAGSGTASKENWSSDLSAHYPIFQGFKTVATVNGAKATFQANAAQHRSNQQELMVRVTESYYRLLQAERLVKVAEQSVQRARLHLDFSNARFNAGLASRSDILKARVEHSDAQLARIKARNARLSTQGQLNIYIDRAVQLPLEITDDLESGNVGADSSFFIAEAQFEKFLQLAVQNRPELDKMTKQILVQQANIQMTRSAYFPTLSLDGNYNFAGETISDLSSVSYLGVSLNFPLFSGLARPARLKQEKLALQNLTQQQESLRQQISIEVWNAHLQAKEATERITNSRIFYENALENRNIAEGEYREGVGSMLDVIDAQTALVNSEQTLIEALADYKIALATLDRAVGIKNVKEIVK